MEPLHPSVSKWKTQGFTPEAAARLCYELQAFCSPIWINPEVKLLAKEEEWLAFREMVSRQVLKVESPEDLDSYFLDWQTGFNIQNQKEWSDLALEWIPWMVGGHEDVWGRLRGDYFHPEGFKEATWELLDKWVSHWQIKANGSDCAPDLSMVAQQAALRWVRWSWLEKDTSEVARWIKKAQAALQSCIGGSSGESFGLVHSLGVSLRGGWPQIQSQARTTSFHGMTAIFIDDLSDPSWAHEWFHALDYVLGKVSSVLVGSEYQRASGWMHHSLDQLPNDPAIRSMWELNHRLMGSWGLKNRYLWMMFPERVRTILIDSNGDSETVTREWGMASSGQWKKEESLFWQKQSIGDSSILDRIRNTASLSYLSLLNQSQQPDFDPLQRTPWNAVIDQMERDFIRAGLGDALPGFQSPAERLAYAFEALFGGVHPFSPSPEEAAGHQAFFRDFFGARQGPLDK